MTQTNGLIFSEPARNRNERIATLHLIINYRAKFVNDKGGSLRHRPTNWPLSMRKGPPCANSRLNLAVTARQSPSGSGRRESACGTTVPSWINKPFARKSWRNEHEAFVIERMGETYTHQASVLRRDITLMRMRLPADFHASIDATAT